MNEQSQRISKIAYSLVSLVGILLALMLCCVIFAGDVFCWFSLNKEVEANQLSVAPARKISASYFRKASGDAKFTEITSWDDVFEGLVPGQSVVIQAVYKNAGDEDYTATLSLMADDGDEVPLVMGGNYYYFGSQLKITDITTTTEITTKTADPQFLIAPNTNENVTYHEAEQTVPDIELCEFTLASGQTFTVDITIEFVNLPTVSQDEYKYFTADNDDACCRRYLLADFTEKTIP